MSMVSETDTCREELAPYCQGQIGMDVGYGGSKIVPHAWAFDMERPYTNVGEDRQQLRGDCRNFTFLCNEALDFVYSAHVLEDFWYGDLRDFIIPEWRRVLRVGGLLVTNCPDQQRFLAHCALTGQGLNMAHKEPRFSLSGFKFGVLIHTGQWNMEFEKPEHGPYSWLLVLRKL